MLKINKNNKNYSSTVLKQTTEQFNINILNLLKYTKEIPFVYNEVLNYKNNLKNNNITWDWISGFLQGDGSFGINIKIGSQQVIPYISFSQRESSDLLPLINEFFNEKGIKTIYNINKGDNKRAPQLKITNTKNVKKWLDIWNDNNQQLLGTKFRDLLILKELVLLCNSTTGSKKLGPDRWAIILDLKMALHQTSISIIDKPILVSHKKSRQDWEKLLKLNKSSVGAANQILFKIDNLYQENLLNKNIKINANFVQGLIEAEGGFSLIFEILKSLKLKPFFHLCLNSEEIVELKYLIQKLTRSEHLFYSYKQKKAISFRTSNKTILKNILIFFLNNKVKAVGSKANLEYMLLKFYVYYQDYLKLNYIILSTIIFISYCSFYKSASRTNRKLSVIDCLTFLKQQYNWEGPLWHDINELYNLDLLITKKINNIKKHKKPH